MRKVLCAIAFGFLFAVTTFADSMAPPPGVNLCKQYAVCGTPTTIEVELGGVGSNTWTDVIELSSFYQGNAFCFSDGTCLPPGSLWITFLWPGVGVGLSSPLTWRPDPPDPNPRNTSVPEPSTILLLVAGLAILIPALQRTR